MSKRRRHSRKDPNRRRRSAPKEQSPEREEKLGRLELPAPPERLEPEVYLMQAADGTLVRVPADRLEAWQSAQANSGSEPLSKEEGQMLAAVLEMLYGKEGR